MKARNTLARFALCAGLLAMAAIAAGLYGVVHNQLSYTVSPDYFLLFKFHQFNVSEHMYNRSGAGWVGWMASWRMGLIIGLPILVVGWSIRSSVNLITSFVKILLAVILITAAFGLSALALGAIIFDSTPEVADGFNRGMNPNAFRQAGFMHNFSYLGGFVGLVVGCILMFRFRRKYMQGEKA